MAKKEDLRVRKTKSALYKSLLNLMKVKTFEEIKVTDICKESMINRSTFYDHFNDKYELLSSFIKDSKTYIQNQMKKDYNPRCFKEYFTSVVKALVYYIDDLINNYSLIEIIKRNDNTAAYDIIYSAALEETIHGLKKYFKNTSTIPNESIAVFCVSGTIRLFINDIKEGKKYNKEKTISDVAEMIPDLNYLEPIKKEQ